jgi:hypothetical protein
MASRSGRKPFFFEQRHHVRLGEGEDRARAVRRVAGLGAEDDVAGVREREGHVGDQLLGADAHADLLGLEVDAVALLHERRDGALELVDALGRGVLVDVLVVQVGDHRVEQEPGRRLVGVADAQVDDILALLLEGGALALELGEEVRGSFLSRSLGWKPMESPCQKINEGRASD